MKRKVGFLSKAAMVSVALMFMVVGIVQAASVTIDSFDAGLNQSITITIPDDGTGNPDLPQTASSRRTSTAAIGGERDLILTLTAGQIDDQGRWRAQTATGYYLSLAEDPNVAGTATAQWDGTADATPGDLDCTTGLGGTDLTGGGTNDGIVVRVEFSDLTPNLTLKVYTDCSNWGQKSIDLPVVASGNVADIFLPFTSFGGGAGTLNFASVRAIELVIDTTSDVGADVQIKFIKATSLKEYGDLPDSGTPTYLQTIRDAYFIPQGLRLGVNVDADANHQPNSDATGDDIAGTPDDEDGVSRDMTDFWVNDDATTDLFVTVNGCSGTCYFNGWIDWNVDGDFLDANEQVFDDSTMLDGSNQVKTFTVPGSGVYTVGTDVFARFMICTAANTCDDPTDSGMTNGEIEDYWWAFGPTAITLSGANARSGASTAIPFAVAAVLLVAGAGALVALRRKQA